jgi:hypothetical protein
MTKTIYRLDASAIKSAAGCMRKLYWQVVTGYHGRGINNDIAYGSAIHIFKDSLKKTEDPFKATEEAYKYFKGAMASEYFRVKPNKAWMNLAHLAETCRDYIEKFGVKHEKDNFQSLKDSSSETIIVERKFQIPLLEEEEFIIFLCGTIDDIGKFNSGIYAIADEKVTAYWDKDRFFRPFKLSTQLITYAWALRWHIRNIKDSPLFKELEDKNIGAFINGIFVSKGAPTEFVRSEIITIDESLLNEYEVKLFDLTYKLSTAIQLKQLPIREGIMNDACFGKFNEPCEFTNACYAPDEESAWSLNDRTFDKLEYNPLEHRDLTKK